MQSDVIQIAKKYIGGNQKTKIFLGIMTWMDQKDAELTTS